MKRSRGTFYGLFPFYFPPCVETFICEKKEILFLSDSSISFGLYGMSRAKGMKRTYFSFPDWFFPLIVYNRVGPHQVSPFCRISLRKEKVQIFFFFPSTKAKFGLLSKLVTVLRRTQSQRTFAPNKLFRLLGVQRVFIGDKCELAVAFYCLFWHKFAGKCFF